MRATDRMVLKVTVLAGMAVAASVGVWAQTSAPASNSGAQTASTAGPVASPTASQPAAGTTPVGGDAPAPAKQPDSGTASTTTASNTQLAPCETGKSSDKKDKKKDKDSKDTA